MVTAELIRALAAEPAGRGVRVFLEKDSLHNLAQHELQHLPGEWVVVPHHSRSPDYVDRWYWSRAVLAAQGRDRRPLFIPYLYNYGRLDANLVLIPDLVYRQVPDYGGAAPNQPWWSRRGRLPFRPLVRKWEERRAARAGQVVVYSRYVGEEVTRYLQVPPEQQLLIPCGPPHWLTQPADKSALPPGLPARFVLYCGGYAVRKNVPLLLRACQRAAQAESDFRCVFVGLEKIFPEALDNFRFDIAPGVVSLPAVDHPTLAALYRACAFVVYPSRAEGFGLPVIEAAACGKICLCGDNTSLREVQPEARFRLPDDNEDAWTAALLERWRDVAGTAAAGESAKSWAANYTWTEAAQRLLAAAQKMPRPKL